MAGRLEEQVPMVSLTGELGTVTNGSAECVYVATGAADSCCHRHRQTNGRVEIEKEPAAAGRLAEKQPVESAKGDQGSVEEGCSSSSSKSLGAAFGCGSGRLSV